MAGYGLWTFLPTNKDYVVFSYLPIRDDSTQPKCPYELNSFPRLVRLLGGRERSKEGQEQRPMRESNRSTAPNHATGSTLYPASSGPYQCLKLSGYLKSPSCTKGVHDGPIVRLNGTQKECKVQPTAVNVEAK